MRAIAMVAMLLATAPVALTGQQLRQVPQRFIYVQPLGLVAGIGTAGVEFATGRRTSVEVTVLGVYTGVDDVELFGGGAGIGFRRYFRSGETAGTFGGIRVDGVRLTARDDFGEARSAYLGLGALVGHRWVTRGGMMFEPLIGYEFLIGPRPLIARSDRLQRDLGVLLGVGVGWAW